MEDFGFKLQNIKDKYGTKKTLKIVLSVLAVVIVLLILILIIKAFSDDDSTEQVENVVLIKSDVKNIKKSPDDKGGLVIDNLDVSVYDIIDNSEDSNSKPVINNTEQNINLDSNTNSMAVDQYLLEQKINEMSQENEIIVKNNDTNEEKKISSNITINNDKKESTTNINDLKQLGNNALIENLKNNKDIKPGIKVQILALTSKEGLIEYWNDIKSKYSSLINDKNYYIEQVNINNSIIYRLQIGNFLTNESAEDFCKKYIQLTNKNKIDCIIVKNN